jgi:hypothetical protein
MTDIVKRLQEEANWNDSEVHDDAYGGEELADWLLEAAAEIKRLRKEVSNLKTQLANTEDQLQYGER